MQVSVCEPPFILSLPAVIDPDTVRSDLDELTTGRAEYHQRVVHYVEDNETNVEVMRGILFPNSNILFTVQTHDPGEKRKPSEAATAEGGFNWAIWGNNLPATGTPLKTQVRDVCLP